MTAPPQVTAAADPHPARVGALCMVAAVFCFTLLDAIGKHLVVSGVNPLQAVWGRYAFSAAPLLLLPVLAGWRRVATTRPGLQLARGLTLIGATAAMFTALRSLQLADAYALSYVSPLIVAAMSHRVLHERLTRWQWAALLVSFGGALVVIRPAFAQAGIAIVFPLLMAVSYAAYQVLTRVARRTDDATVCVFHASLAGALLMSLLMPFVWEPLPLVVWGWFAAAGTLGVVGHWLLAVAANRAPPSLLSPLIYLQLLYAALLGFAIFGSIPDGWTIIGSTIILAGGALLWLVAPRG